MPLNVERKADCPLCEALWNQLDQMQLQLSSTDGQEHLLASIGSWWVANSLALFNGNPMPMMNALMNCLAENGIRSEVIKETRR
jgi:hypothetical protein